MDFGKITAGVMDSEMKQEVLFKALNELDHELKSAEKQISSLKDILNNNSMETFNKLLDGMIRTYKGTMAGKMMEEFKDKYKEELK